MRDHCCAAGCSRRGSHRTQTAVQYAVGVQLTERFLAHPLLWLAGRLLFLSCLAGFAPCAHAQTAPAQWSPQVWLNAGTYSHHFDRSKDFREDNVGFGAEAWFAENHALMAGTFINSDRARSHYVAYQWRPLQWQLADFKFGAGITLGAFDGYPRYQNGDWFPAALPVFAIEYKRVGVNIFLVPTIRDRLDGAIALQFKLRVW